MRDVIIIGGGFSGLVAGIMLARKGKTITIIEKNDRIGKKILATGNGKCNLASVGEVKGKYNNDFPFYAIEKYGLEDEKEFFMSIGVPLRERDGRVYPYSEDAGTVLNALRREIEKLNVEVVTGEEVTSIESGFLINKKYRAKKVILATGSNATMGSFSADLINKFGHKIIAPNPALVPILTAPEVVKGLRGIRARMGLTLTIDGNVTRQVIDEVLFKDNGISGTATFNLSVALARARKYNSARVKIDFMPEYSLEEVIELIKKSGGINGFFHKEIVTCLQRVSKEGSAYSLAYAIKNYDLGEVKLGAITLAQVVSGGLDTEQFDNVTLESKLINGLYATGEVLDVDGECGGYNLMWAYASARLVGDTI